MDFYGKYIKAKTLFSKSSGTKSFLLLFFYYDPFIMLNISREYCSL